MTDDIGPIFDYLESCPYCGSEHIYSDDTAELDGSYYDVWKCEDCKRAWYSE